MQGSLVVFSDDWGRHPSSCQHLVEHLLGDYEVLWINTIGTRTPKIDRATAARVVSKLSQWTSASHDGESNGQASAVRVCSPLMWPWFGRPFDRWLNERILRRALARAIESLPRPRCAITTIGLVADLVGQIDVDGWIYYSVDDLAAWPGLDGDTLRRMEQELVAKVDRRVAASAVLQSRLGEMGQESTLVTHGVDVEHWNRVADSIPLPSSLVNVDPPWVVFWGLIDDRLEADWLLRLADRMQLGTVLLAGPAQACDERLRGHSRIQLTGPLEYRQLPAVARRASVLVMPYRRMPATLAMQPLKLKEYLATGLPCVVSRLPATEPWSDALDVADDAGGFVELVIDRLSGSLPTGQAVARRSLAAESWAAKAQQFKAVIDSAIACHSSEHTSGHSSGARR